MEKMKLDGFTVEDFRKELAKELSMRSRVWPHITGMPENFHDPKHQRRYDILKQLLCIMEFGGVPTFELYRRQAISNLEIVENGTNDLFSEI